MSEPQTSGSSAQPSSAARRALTKVLAGIGGLAAAAVSTSLALYHLRAAPETPTLTRGEPVEAGKWTVVLIGARTAATTPDGRPVRNGGRAAIVELMLENRTASASNDVYDLVTIEGLPPGVEKRPTAYLVRDKELFSYAQPRLEERVALAWIWPKGAEPPRDLKLTLHADRFKPKDNLYAAPGWFDPHVVGSATLPAPSEEQRP